MKVGDFTKLFLALALMVSCLDPINLGVDGGLTQGISIDAKLVASNPPQFRMVAERLFNYDLNSRQRISMRSVSLENSLGERVEIPQRGTGIYFLEIEDPGFTIEDGISYRLLITQVDGPMMETTFEPLWSIPESTTLDKSSIEIERIDPRLGLVTIPAFEITGTVPLQSSEPDANARMRWDMQEIYALTDDSSKVCYLSNNQDIFNVRVFDTNLLSSAGSVPLTQGPITPFMAEGYYFIAIRESLSETAYTHWKNLETVVEREGGQFEPTAGRLATNFEYVSENPPGDIFGFFYATTQDTSRIYISPEDAGNPTPFCLIPVEMPPAFPCGNCLEQEGATLIRPAWWVED